MTILIELKDVIECLHNFQLISCPRFVVNDLFCVVSSGIKTEGVAGPSFFIELWLNCPSSKTVEPCFLVPSPPLAMLVT